MKLLSERDSELDVGANFEAASERQPENLSSLVIANSKRVQESLRVMEELAKLSELSPTLNSNDFKQARFKLYTLEQELLSRILRRDKLSRLSGLYIILDTEILKGKDVVEIATRVIHGGAKVIQLRDKHCSKRELLLLAQKLRDLCYESNILFIVNDYLDIALGVDADGLHIGQTDLPLSVVRGELSVDKIVGCSTADLSQALEAEGEGADYIAVGSIFSSSTKEDATVVGIETLKQIRQAVSVPLVAIGGINRENISQVVSAGADAAAVISAILMEEDTSAAVYQMVAEIERIGQARV